MVPKPLRKILAALMISAVTMSSFALPASAETQNPELSSANYEAARDAYAYNGNIGYTNANWMSKIPGDKKISQLSIPGTHNSMSRYGGGGLYPDDFIKTQLMDLSTQLNSGIRYLDIRLRKDSNTSMSAYHGSVNQNASFSGDILDKVKAFLQANPNETVVMRVKNECNGPGTGKCTDAPTSKTWAQVFEDTYYNNPSYSNYFWKGSSNNPTLNEVRGKIVVASNFPTDGKRFGIPYSQFNNQDQYEIDDTPDSMYGKWEAVGNQLKAAHANSGQSLFLNHLSGNGTWKFITQGAKPWFVASGYESKETGANKKKIGSYITDRWPDFPRVIGGGTHIFYGGMNIMATQYIRQWPINHAGIIAADFPGKGLISTVVALNDKHMADDVKYIQTEGSNTVKVGFSGSIYLKNHYKVYLNGNYIMSVENGQHYYGSWNATDSGHELKRADRTLFTGDKVEVRLVNNGKETVVKSHTVSVSDGEGEEIRVPDGNYILKSKLNLNKAVALNLDPSNNIALWDYTNLLQSEFTLTYVEYFKAYRLNNRYNPNLVMGWDNHNGSINVKGISNTSTIDENYWKLKRTADGYIYFENLKNGHVLDIQAGSTANGANLNVWPFSNTDKQKFQLIERKETKKASIVSEKQPLPGQSNRSSGNFKLADTGGKKVRVVIKNANRQEANIKFKVKRDKSMDTDPDIWTNVGNGTILDPVYYDLYIANPSGATSNFTVEFYTLDN